ncbi:hypothetical protein COY26_02785 [Candidatus Woesearchaeota archaeon CG_4_10_14_0_2_um_filter_33_10]|nr:MAG: hypothetical protein COY26_02785 [Candidatus Woesearchaeota archaeon CG_4_10_14_0_2_um_filter_33_10]
MKPKRVLIASFVLIFVGLFFMLNFDGNITGAVAGAPSTALSLTSSVLFGFFFIWLAGIMLVGTIDEKVTTKVLKEREKEMNDFLLDQEAVVTKIHTKEIEKTGKKLHELTGEQRIGIAGKIYEGLGKDYTDFLGVKATKYFGNARLKRLYVEDARVSDDDIKNLSNLTLKSLNETYISAKSSLHEGLSQDIFSDVLGNKKNMDYLSKEFQEKLGVKTEKIKSIKDITGLYTIFKEKEKGKKSDEYLNKLLENYRK